MKCQRFVKDHSKHRASDNLRRCENDATRLLTVSGIAISKMALCDEHRDQAIQAITEKGLFCNDSPIRWIIERKINGQDWTFAFGPYRNEGAAAVAAQGLNQNARSLQLDYSYRAIAYVPVEKYSEGADHAAS